MVNFQVKKAIKAIREDVETAFFLFGLMEKKRKSFKSAHNFGVFLSKYGKETSYFSSQIPILSECLLLKAKKGSASFITLKELGDLYFELEEYEKAISSYNNAMELGQSYHVCYNLASCYYSLKDYKNMNLHLKKSIDNYVFSNDDLVHLYEMLAFSYTFINNTNEAKILLYFLSNNPAYEKSPDTLKLAFLCKDYSFVIENYQQILNDWMFDFESFKIIYQSFNVVKPGFLSEFEKRFRKGVELFYLENNDFDPESKQLLLKQLDSKDRTPNIQLTFPFSFSCDFYVN